MDNFINDINNNINITDLLNMISSYYDDICYRRDQEIARQKLRTALMIDTNYSNRPLWIASIQKRLRIWNTL